MNEKTVIDFLALQNRWWYSKKDFPIMKIHDFKRSDYYHLIRNELREKEATIVYGPRGVGKSTVLLEIIRELLGFPKTRDEIASIDPTKLLGIDGKRILYVTFEQPSIRKIDVLEVIRIFAKYLLGEDISKLKKEIFVFLDEIQNVPNWGDQLKIIQDLEYPIKFFVTGSSSIAMKNEASKGARRFNLYSMHPLKFSDFVCYKLHSCDFKEKIRGAKPLRITLKDKCFAKDSKGVFDLFMGFYNDIKPWQTQIELLYDEYLIKGGYPLFLDQDDYNRISSKLLRDFLLGFHKDLVVGKGIGDPVGMRDLLEYIASISSSETNYSSLMENSGSAANTEILKKYLYHLQNAFLISISHRFPKGSHKKGHSFKIYLTDIAIRNMLTGLMNKLLFKDPFQYGFATETVVFDHIMRLHFKLKPDTPLYHWKDEKTNKEVDIIMKFNGIFIPIEVKKADEPSLDEVEGLVSLCADGTPGIVACGKKLGLEENIIFLPHWLLMLLC